MAVLAASSVIDAISYDDLYVRWERGNWRATEIDFSQDVVDWRERLTEEQRRSALWLYALFFHGEDSVADNLSPYIDAAPLEEQKYFLTTQQVDEARHAVFFKRFMHEVVGAGDGTMAGGLRATSGQITWGHRKVFSRLDRMADELRRDRSLPKFAQAIALYHMVVEATLAQPGQHYIEDFFTKAGTMPGFSAGMHNVARDEQRHIGFGVKTLADAFSASDECKAAVAELLQEILPYALAVFIPPNWDLRYTREYGFELEDIYAFGIRSVRSKWRATGYPVEDMPAGVFPIDPELSDEEIASRQIKLLRAGVLGPPNGRPDAAPEVQRIYFDVVARSADPAAAGDRPMTIQWRFADADNWHLVVDNGTTRAEPGDASGPDVTFETTWQDWIDVSLRGIAPWRAVASRRLRPHGSPASLLRARRMFPKRPALN